MPYRTSAALIIALAVLGRASTAVPAQTPPKLAVLFVVDQMRADYVDRFQSEWTGGLKRMVTRGAWFRQAAYPYLTTVTCAGHATVSTGAFPRTHGIIQNAWWDRDAGRQVTCTADGEAHDISYGDPVKGGDSAHQLAVPTFTDLMRTERGAHVVTLSLKDRSAIMLAGHGADAATWLSESLDRWETSSVFGDGTAPPVKAFLASHPMDADYGRTWERLLPTSHYRHPDDAPGEAPPSGWTATFPHVLKGAGKGPDAEFRAQWERSPFADAYLGSFAAALVESMQLGHHDGTDVLGVSFSSTDLVGHAFGPDSQEVQDMYAHLDQTIGTLLNRLDALVGRDRYVVALTADHGVTPIPEQMTAAGKDGGRLNATTIGALIDTRAGVELGTGHYVARVNGNDIYFEPGMYAKLLAAPKAMDAVLTALRGSAGIAAAFTAEQVRSGTASEDRLLKEAAFSYFQGRSGDLVIVPKPGWMFSATGTTHGTGSDDDQRVPVLLYGAGIRPGTYAERITPADVTPTLAAIFGVTMSQADGHPIKGVLRPAP